MGPNLSISYLETIIGGKMSGLLFLTFFALLLQFGAGSQARSMETDVRLDQAAALSRNVGHECPKIACKMIGYECMKRINRLSNRLVEGISYQKMKTFCRQILEKVCL